MNMRALESAITSEARRHFNNRTLRVKDLQEWSTGPIKVQAGEVVERLPLNGVYVAIKVEHDKRKVADGVSGTREVVMREVVDEKTGERLFRPEGIGGVTPTPARPTVDELMALVYLFGSYTAEHPENSGGFASRLAEIRQCAEGIAGVSGGGNG